MKVDQAIKALGSDTAKAAEMAAYHKLDRPYLGVSNPAIDACVKEWRQTVTHGERIALAQDLWDSNIHEGRVAAAKLLTQARIRPEDETAWQLITDWVPTFDAWAVADHASIAGQKRLVADPSRLDTLEIWITSDHMWTKRAALVMTLPWTKQNHPKPADLDARDRILGWAASCVSDHDRFIQKAIAWWLRELSKHDAPRVHAFLSAHSDQMKPWAVKDAARLLPA